MATERLVIEINERGARVVKRDIENIGKGGTTAARGVGQLKAALSALAASAVLRQLAELAESYTTIQNRLRLVTTDQANLNAVFNELQEISVRTRSSLEANAQLYSRIAVSAKELGVSQAELLTFTERLNKAIKISGATTVEAENAIVQLSQGMASGTLRGDELRSVLEQLPAVADVIAKSMGVTRGELRQLGFEGKITASQILQAFREVGPELDASFAKTVPTMREGFTLLRNQLIETVGVLDQALGGSSAVGGAFAAIAETLREFQPALLNVVRAFKGALDPSDELSENMKRLATVLVVAEGVIRILATALSSTLGVALRTVARTLTGVVSALIAAVHGDFAAAGEYLKSIWTETASDVVDSSVRLREGLTGEATKTIDKLTKIWDKGAREIQDRQREAVGEVSSEAGPAALKGPSAAEEKARARLERQLNQVLNRINPIPGAQLEMARSRDVLTRAEERGLLTEEQLVENLGRLGIAYRDQLDPLGALNRALEDEQYLLSLTAREREIEAQMMQYAQQLQDRGKMLTYEEAIALRDRLEALRDTNLVVAEQDALLAQSVDRRKQFQDQLLAITNLLADPSSGFTKSDATGAVMGVLGEDLFSGTADMLQVQADRYAEMYAQIDALRQQDLISEQAAHASRVRLWVESQSQQLDTATTFFGQLAQLQKSENSKMAKIGKAAAIAQALISTYKSATEAYAAMAGIPYVGPALGVAAAAAAIAAGMANVQAIRNTPTGFQKGGYTGDAAMDEVAGVVHGREFVMNAGATRRLGKGNLDALQRGEASITRRGAPRPAKAAQAAGATVNVSIENHGSPKDFEVQQLTPNDVRIIARDEISKQTPDLVSSEMGNPNSKISKAMSKNTNASRRR